MIRKEQIDKLENTSQPFDICIIGGGATGLGAGVDAASRGYKTILLEQFDFAKGTSSRSTKLVHGGVRYLQQGNIKLVMEALKERGILRQNASHLVKNQSFIVPNYKWWEGPYYGLGLKVYDWMSGSLGLGTSQWLSTEEVLAKAPTLDAEGLKGGVIYHDGQFDDARLAVNLAQTIVEQGGIVVNYCQVTGLMKSNNRLLGVEAVDQLSGKSYSIRAKVVINATGVFSDSIQSIDDPQHTPSIAPSQGIHIVLDKSFLPGESAIMIPHTDDGRVLFAVPWHNRIIVGTTDTARKEVSAEPRALPEEIDFIMEHAARYLTKDPGMADIKSIFAGLRPLVRANSKRTAELSRDHTIIKSDSGLISIVGGKWTTYRKMAEDVVDAAAGQAKLPEVKCLTDKLPVHGAQKTSDYNSAYYYYGTDWEGIRAMETQNTTLAAPIHPSLPYTKGMVAWAVKEEMAMRLEDVMSRRTRALLLDARASLEAAPEVAVLMASLMDKDEGWVSRELEHFNNLAKNYLP